MSLLPVGKFSVDATSKLRLVLDTYTTKIGNPQLQFNGSTTKRVEIEPILAMYYDKSSCCVCEIDVDLIVQNNAEIKAIVESETFAGVELMMYANGYYNRSGSVGYLVYNI